MLLSSLPRRRSIGAIVVLRFCQSSYYTMFCIGRLGGMRRRWLVACALGLALVPLFVPAAARAEQSTVWDFRAARVQGRWEARGLQTQKTFTGLLIRATEDGRMTQEIAPAHGSEVVSITAQASRATPGIFLWQERGAPQGVMVQLPFTIPGGPNPIVLDLNAGKYDQWDPRPAAIGIAFPAGSQVLLQEIRLRHWPLHERILHAWKSFWTFDRFEAYSINFLWGPLLTSNPVASADMFDSLPAEGRSANAAFYVVALVAFATAAGYSTAQGKRNLHARRSAFLAAFAILGFCWVLYDVRMGSEILAYARRDFATYVNRPLLKRTFRSRDDLYAVFAQAVPVLREDSRVGLLTPWPLLGVARYLLYPTLLTIPGEEGAASVRTWLVFQDPDARVDERGRLLSVGVALTGSGVILQDYGKHSFLFRTSTSL